MQKMCMGKNHTHFWARTTTHPANPTSGKLDKFCLKAPVTATCLKTLMAKGFITQPGSFGEGVLSNRLLGTTALDASDDSPTSGWGFDTA